MSTIRPILRLIGIVLTLLAALVLHGLWRLVRAPSPWPRLLLGSVGWWCGARARVVGRPLRRDVVFVSNHLSWLDILLIAGATGATFVAKSELKAVPLVGWLCTLNRTIFVQRGDRMGVEAQVEQVRDALRQGWAVTLFPEGTTGDGHTLLPFKAALFAALAPPPPGVAVQPIRLDYGAATDDLAWVGDESGLSHAGRVRRRPGRFPATLRCGEPCAPAGGRKAIAADARARMEALAPIC